MSKGISNARRFAVGLRTILQMSPRSPEQTAASSSRQATERARSPTRADDFGAPLEDGSATAAIRCSTLRFLGERGRKTVDGECLPTSACAAHPPAFLHATVEPCLGGSGHRPRSCRRARNGSPRPRRPPRFGRRAASPRPRRMRPTSYLPNAGRVLPPCVGLHEMQRERHHEIEEG